MRLNKLIQYFIDCIPFMVEFLLFTIIIGLIAYIVLVIDYNTKQKRICKYLRKQVQKIK